MKKIILWSVVGFLVFIAAIGFFLLRQFAPPPGPLPTYADVAYAPADPQGSNGHLLDLYLPESGGPSPVVIWTGGSAWMADNGKDFAAWLAPALNQAGFALAGVSIRSSAQTTFPGQIHDIKAAIRWLRANSEEYAIDGNNIGIMGDSSGGWAAAMAGVTGDVPVLEGSIGISGQSSAVQAVVAFYPPTRFLEMDANTISPCTPGAGILSVLMGKVICHDPADSPESMLIGCQIQTCPEKVLLADPTQYITPQDPPFLILHGEADPLVPPAQSELLYTMLSEACHDTSFISLPLAGHGPAYAFLNDNAVKVGATLQSTTSKDCISRKLPNYEPGWNTILDFLKHNLFTEQ